VNKTIKWLGITPDGSEFVRTRDPLIHDPLNTYTCEERGDTTSDSDNWLTTKLITR